MIMTRKRFLILSITLITAFAGCKYAVLLLPDPHEKTQAEYQLPKNKKIAILVDDYLSPIGNPSQRLNLAKKIAQNLIDSGALRAGNLIDSQKVFDTPADSPEGKKLSIQHIGRKVGADDILYVNIIDFNLQSDPENPLIVPKAKAYVKVIEVETGERLWPIDLAGRAVETKGRMEGDVAEDADKTQFADKLIDELSATVAELFFEHTNR